MNTAMTKEELARILDQALQDVTEQTAGVCLHQGDQPPGEDLCTVHKQTTKSQPRALRWLSR